MQLAVSRALAVFETHFMRDALAALGGLMVFGAGAAMVIARKRDKTDEALRHSTDENTEKTPERSQIAEQRTLETLLSAVESGRVSLDPQMGLSAEPVRSAEAGRSAPAVSAGPPAQANGHEALKERRRPPRFTAPDTEGYPRPSPWRPGDAQRHAGAPRVFAESKQQPSGAPPAANGGGTGSVREGTEATAKNGTPARLPRLTELRGKMFSMGIKELDQARNGAELGTEIERLTGPLPSLEALLQRARARNGTDRQEAPEAAQGATPESAAALAPANETSPQDIAGQSSTAEHAPPEKPAKAARRKLDSDAREPYDKVEILPSRRGQYKRKP